MATTSKSLRRETFNITAPDAKSVFLAGDFTEWEQRAVRMQKGKNGVWTITVPLAPGKHSYRFIVDGEWRDDPECPEHVPNPFGGEDMVREAA